MLKVEGLKFKYKKDELMHGLSFAVDKGECFVVAGTNGSGKSTLTAILAGILKPDEGRVSVDGKIAYVPQGISLFEDMKVEDNLRFFASAAGVKVKKDLPFGVDKILDKKVRDLSIGTKKRVSIACSVMADYDVLLLDEPCAGLDLCYRDELIEYISGEKSLGRIIMYVGHEPAEFAGIFDRILVLGGEKPFICTREEVAARGGVYKFLRDAEMAIR